MKKIIIISIIIICNTFSIFALPDCPAKEDSTVQTTTEIKENLLFAEILGNGLVLTLNYERYFTDNLSFRVGYGTDIFLNSTYMPLLFNYSFEKPFEVGLGIVTYNFKTGHSGGKIFGHKDSGVFITSLVGIKKKFKGMLLKFSFTPFYNPETSKIHLYGGLSFGIVF